jgi:hypothetical protein
VFRDILGWFDQVLGGMRGSQRKTLARLVASLVVGRQAGIAAIGRSIRSDARMKHRIKQTDRFLGNSRVSVEMLCAGIVQTLNLAARPRLLVALDWTTIGNYEVLTSALPSGSRALPIYWTVIDLNSESRIDAQIRHLKALKALLPAGMEIVIIADRGFDGAPFLKTLDGLGFQYVIRASCDFLFSACYTLDEYCSLEDFDVCRGVVYDFGAVKYTKEHGYSTRMVVLHDHRQKDRWILLSLLGDSEHDLVRYYGRRFEVEEAFKDLKDLRGGFQLKGFKMKRTDRLARLLAVAVLAYLVLVLAGTCGEKRGLHRSLQVNTATKRCLALWRVGYLLLREAALTVSEALLAIELLSTTLIT